MIRDAGDTRSRVIRCLLRKHVTVVELHLTRYDRSLLFTVSTHKRLRLVVRLAIVHGAPLSSLLVGASRKLEEGVVRHQPAAHVALVDTMVSLRRRRLWRRLLYWLLLQHVVTVAVTVTITVAIPVR